MKVTEDKSPALLSNVDRSEVVDVRIGGSREAQMMIIDMLVNSLYTDKVSAVWREFGANAADANTEAGRPETPIEITLPSKMSPEAVIRDFGYGMTETKMRDVYCCLGESTKRETQIETGMFGVGAKVGYAYGEMFTVTCFNAGQKSIYQFFRDKDGLHMLPISREPCDTPEGTEIRVPVRSEHLFDFTQKAESVFRYFKVQPIVHGGTLDYQRGHAVFHGEGWRVTGDLRPVAVMGNVGYAISVPALNLYSDSEKVVREVLTLGVELDFAIGELEITASREGLQYKDGTRKAIIAKARKAIAELAVVFKNQIAAAPTLWAAKRAYADAFEKMGGTVQQSLRNVIDDKVDWRGEPIKSGRVYLECEKDETGVSVARFEKRSYGRKKITRDTDPTFIFPTDNVKLVINDLPKRTVPPSRVKGFFYHNPDAYQLVVFTFESQTAQDNYWQRCKLEGAPTAPLSSLPSILAIAGGSTSTHNPKHSAHAFTLDETFTGQRGYGHKDARSQWWQPVTVDLEADSGVYVELSQFKVVHPNSGVDSIEPDDFTSDMRAMRKLGLLRGPVYAFKRSTQTGMTRTIGKKWQPLGAALLQQLQALVAKSGQSMADWAEAQDHTSLLPVALAALLPDCPARQYIEQCAKMSAIPVDKKLLVYCRGGSGAPWMHARDMKLPDPTASLTKFSENVTLRYPMLKWYSGGERNSCTKTLTHLAEYVQMVEQQQKP